MSNDSAIVTLDDGNGNEYPCQILDIFEFQDQQYAMLLKLSDESLVVMRLISRDSGSVFQTIESEDEFERVLAHVTTMAKQSDGEPAAPSQSTPNPRSYRSWEERLHAGLREDLGGLELHWLVQECDDRLARSDLQDAINECFLLTLISPSSNPPADWVEVLQDRDAWRRCEALGMLGALGTTGEQLLPEIFEMLDDQDYEVRFMALGVIDNAAVDVKWGFELAKRMQESPSEEGQFVLSSWGAPLSERLKAGNDPRTSIDRLHEQTWFQTSIVGSAIELHRDGLSKERVENYQNAQEEQDALIRQCESYALEVKNRAFFEGESLSDCADVWCEALPKLVQHARDDDRFLERLKQLVLDSNASPVLRLNVAAALLDVGGNSELVATMCNTFLVEKTSEQFKDGTPEGDLKELDIAVATFYLLWRLGPAAAGSIETLIPWLEEPPRMIWLYQRYAAEVIEQIGPAAEPAFTSLVDSMCLSSADDCDGSVTDQIDAMRRMAAARAMIAIRPALARHRELLLQLAKWRHLYSLREIFRVLEHDELWRLLERLDHRRAGPKRRIAAEQFMAQKES
jgi:hypothetical protein